MDTDTDASNYPVILLSHPTGNQFVRESLAAFDEAGLLAEFSTTISWPNHRWEAILPARIRTTFARRRYAASLRGRIRVHPLREAARLIAGPRLGGWLGRHETGALSFDAVAREHDAWTAKRVAMVAGLTAVYAYEDCARDTFRAAKSRGLRRIYEHPVGYWREVDRMYAEETELQPAYATVLAGLADSPEKRDRKDEELATADLIIVPSKYAADTLLQYPGALPPTVVIPYGAPRGCVGTPSEPTSRLRVIFVGALQQRKGISYFVDAIGAVSGLVDATVIGQRVGDCGPLDHFLAQARWLPTAPHAAVLEVMRQHDVLVLPSLSEGFGLVVLEAMSQGLTVIVSDHTGAADVVRDGESGYVVPIRSAEQIAVRLELLARDPSLLMSMKSAALNAARRCGWDAYRGALVRAVATRAPAPAR